MRRFFWIRLAIFVRQSRWGFALIGLWFALGTIAFYQVERVPLWEAFLNAIYLRQRRGSFWDLYSFWGQCVLFGIVISIFLLQALQHYNPQEGCRMLAREIKNHAIIVGHGHLGGRIVEHLRRNTRPYVLIEKDPTVVERFQWDRSPPRLDWRRALTFRWRHPSIPAKIWLNRRVLSAEARKRAQEFLQRQTEAWVHQKIPALGGRTPMQAVKDPDGKEIVEALLVEFERRSDEGFSAAIRPDIGALRRLLNLPQKNL